MEPVTLIVAALAAGAQAALQDTAGTAIKDAYEGLKSLIVRKFGKQPVLDSLEQKPESKLKQASAEEDLAAAAKDEQVLASALELLRTVERENPAAAKVVGLDLQRIEAEFLKVGNITSSEVGARLSDSRFSGGITIGDIAAGDPKPGP